MVGSWSFQSLSRDSWWSHLVTLHPCQLLLVSFNPSVGILGGHTQAAANVDRGAGVVSIPQSGFLVVTPDAAWCMDDFGGGFQSLSRDSWWSHLNWVEVSWWLATFQSLSRDSWWSHLGLEPDVAACDPGFQSLSRDSWWSHPPLHSPPSASDLCFNPSVGILGGHTQGGVCGRGGIVKFQSLSRDSWWSHLTTALSVGQS